MTVNITVSRNVILCAFTKNITEIVPVPLCPLTSYLFRVIQAS